MPLPKATVSKVLSVEEKKRDALMKRAKEFHIKLDDVAITDLKFGKEFTAAIDSKQVAEKDSDKVKKDEEKDKRVVHKVRPITRGGRGSSGW